MFQYLPIENEVYSPYIGPYRVFGLRILQSGERGEREVMVLPGVSSDFALVLRLAGLFTRRQLDPLHVVDVLEDML